ncbi:MAG: glycosyltransferase [Planctomycetota bacterium]|nr:glycosyltransferase [Planctomycetota bacterium]
MILVRLILPIHNALRESLQCLDSLRAHTDASYVLNIVDDASDAFCSNALKDWVEKHPSTPEQSITLTRHDQNLGFVKACNRAIEGATEPYLVIINSDVTLTPGWLRRLLTFADAHPKAALITPLANQASFHSFSLPPAWNVFELSSFLGSCLKEHDDIDLVTASGFCMLLRQDLLPSPCFDEAYSPGYGEESDLSMRLRRDGFEVLACPTVYLHHKGAASFGGQTGSFMAHPNYKLFMDRWRDPYHQDLQNYREKAQLSQLRDLFPKAPKHNFVTRIRLFKRVLEERGSPYAIREGVRRASGQVRSSLASRGFKWTVGELQHKAFPKRKRATPSFTVEVPRSGSSLDVLFLLEEVSSAGGVAVILQWANALIMRGYRAMVAVPGESPVFREALRSALFEPYYYKSKQDLAEQFSSRIVVASLWSTASKARYLLDRGKARDAVFYVQDREESFYQDLGVKRKVRRSYSLLRNLWATSPWLQGYLRSLGHESTLLAPGISPNDFYPLPKNNQGPYKILAMARPGKERRGFQRLKHAFERLREGYMSFDLTLFGSNRARPHFPLATVHGFVSGPALRRLYQEADLFVDSSSYQAFGLPNFEAMACGAAVLGPEDGGFGDYVSHGEDAWLVDMRDEESLYQGLRHLLKSPETILHLQREGSKTAQSFHFEAFVNKSLSLFQKLPRAQWDKSPQNWAFR